MYRITVCIIIALMMLGNSLIAGDTEAVVSDWPTRGWTTSTPEEQGMDSELLARMLEHIYNGSTDIHSILIVRNGRLVLDAYFFPYLSTYKHILNSCTKGFTSALVGIAIDKGFIKDANQCMVDYFRDASFANNDSLKRSIRLKHLLTMSSGIDWKQYGPDNILNKLNVSPDWVQFMLDRPMAAQPGTVFNYGEENVHLLSAIISRTTKQSAYDFAKENLFSPLGIEDTYWQSDPLGVTVAGSSLYLQPRDMAKLGFLYLHQGTWDGRTIVSPEWVSTSLTKQASHAGADYGYFWWLKPSLGMKEAWGSGGQHIAIFPDLSMIVVMTGGFPDKSNDPFFASLCNEYIIPSAKSTVLLPENQAGRIRLERLVAKVCQRPAPKPVPPLPQIAFDVNDKIYEFNPNALNVKSMTLHFPKNSNEAELTVDRAEGRLTSVLRLDDVYRINPIDGLSYHACKGHWQDSSTFVVVNSIPVFALSYQYTMRFSGDAVKVRVQEQLSGVDVNLEGRMSSR